MLVRALAVRFPLHCLLLLALAATMACNSTKPRKFYESCGASDECESNLCYAGICTNSCSDSVVCGKGVCIEKVCRSPESVACTTDDACAASFPSSFCGTAACVGGKCKLQAVHAGESCAVGCDGPLLALGVCRDGRCATEGAKTQSCDDANACTTETCQQSPAVCLYTAVTCEDSDACTADSCDKSKGCTYLPIACDDGLACTVDKCAPASGCTHTANPADCSDGKLCTDDSCDVVKGCVYTDNSAPCDDGDVCTSSDQCQLGACVGGKPLVCNDNTPCTTDSCDKLKGCTYAALDGPCDDGDQCTTGDVCVGGQCTAGASQDCGDKNECTTDSCVPATGCAHIDLVGTPCDDGDACTKEGACGGGKCAQGFEVFCDDGNACTIDSCASATGCVFAPVVGNIPCDDNDVCTLNNYCELGQCVAAGKQVCNDENSCTQDSCEPIAGCLFAPLDNGPCADNDACSMDDHCEGGVCVALKPWWQHTFGVGTSTFGRGAAYLSNMVTPTIVALGTTEGQTTEGQDGGATADTSTLRCVGLTKDDKVRFDVSIPVAGEYFAAHGLASNQQGNGFAIAGAWGAKPGNIAHGLLRRYDGDGKQLWQAEISQGAQYQAIDGDGFHAVTTMQSGAWLAVGYQNTATGRLPMWAIVPDAAGAKFVPNTFAEFSGSSEIEAVAVNGAGSPLLVGTRTLNGFKEGIGVFLNADGTLSNSLLFGATTDTALHAVAKADKGWIIAGSRNNSKGMQAMWCGYVSESGELQWEQSYGTVAQSGELWGIAPLPKGFALVGAGVAVVGLDNDIFSLHVDPWGNLDYLRTIPALGHQVLRAVTPLADGEIATVGASEQGKIADMLVQRHNPWGYTTCTPDALACQSVAGCDDGNACTIEDCKAGDVCSHIDRAANVTCGFNNQTCDFGPPMTCK